MVRPEVGRDCHWTRVLPSVPKKRGRHQGHTGAPLAQKRRLPDGSTGRNREADQKQNRVRWDRVNNSSGGL